MKRRGVKESDPYDWEKVDSTAIGNISATGNPSIPIKSDYMHGNITQMTVAASNASGTEYVSYFTTWFGVLADIYKPNRENRINIVYIIKT